MECVLPLDQVADNEKKHLLPNHIPHMDHEIKAPVDIPFVRRRRFALPSIQTVAYAEVDAGLQVVYTQL